MSGTWTASYIQRQLQVAQRRVVLDAYAKQVAGTINPSSGISQDLFTTATDERYAMAGAAAKLADRQWLLELGPVDIHLRTGVLAVEDADYWLYAHAIVIAGWAVDTGATASSPTREDPIVTWPTAHPRVRVRIAPSDVDSRGLAYDTVALVRREDPQIMAHAAIPPAELCDDANAVRTFSHLRGQGVTRQRARKAARDLLTPVVVSAQRASQNSARMATASR